MDNPSLIASFNKILALFGENICKTNKMITIPTKVCSILLNENSSMVMLFLGLCPRIIKAMRVHGLGKNSRVLSFLVRFRGTTNGV